MSVQAIRDFGDIANQDILFQTFSGSNAQGEPTYSDGVILKHCALSRKRRKVILKNGDEDYSDLQIYILDTTYLVTQDDKITFDGTYPPIKMVHVMYDENSNLYAYLVYT
jgi:hypothetical protein